MVRKLLIFLYYSFKLQLFFSLTFFCLKTYNSVKISKFLLGLVLHFIAFLYLSGLKEKIKIKIPDYCGKLCQIIKLMLSVKQSTSSLLRWN